MPDRGSDAVPHSFIIPRDTFTPPPDEYLHLDTTTRDGTLYPSARTEDGRKNLCLPSQDSTTILHVGQPGFAEQTGRYLNPAESIATAQMMQLTGQLNEAELYDFWQILMEGMTEITGAQYGFVSKRMKPGDADSLLEIPPLGEPGNCLSALAFYFDNKKDKKGLLRDYQYQTYGCPCMFMRHEKVFIIPENMGRLLPPNPNIDTFPFPAEAYIGVPLFHARKCFAHFGMMWSGAGLLSRPRLSWGFIEMFLHSLESMVTLRILEKQGFAKPEQVHHNPTPSTTSEDFAHRQSLRPLAPNLSHEIRTPMQGVFGSLDVMHAFVLESMLTNDTEETSRTLGLLAGYIQEAQDSTRRAIVAAEKLVHAYDIDMLIPQTPPQMNDFEGDLEPHAADCGEATADDAIDDCFQHNKRRRSVSPDSTEPYPPAVQNGGPHKKQKNNNNSGPPSTVLEVTPRTVKFTNHQNSPLPSSDHPGISLRELISSTIHDSLKIGSRPDTLSTFRTENGEKLHTTKNSDGEIKVTDIYWIVDGDIEDNVHLDGSALRKLLSGVFHNSVKFTETGTIKVHVSIDSRRNDARVRFLVFRVTDTGCGIPEEFIPRLFVPFAREDESLTRRQDGLGLGMMVAKSMARGLGGDLVLERTKTEGPNRGSEFVFRVMISSPLVPASETVEFPGPPHLSRLPSPATKIIGVAPLVKLSQGFCQDGTVKVPVLETSISAPERDYLASIQFPRIISRIQPLPEPSSSFDQKLATKMPHQVLIVEDNDVLSKILERMLWKLGFLNIMKARDGQQAVDLMRQERVNPVKIVLMDIWMPKMNGYEASREITRLPQYLPHSDGRAHLVILGQTGDTTRSCRNLAIEAGMQDVMVKPFGIKELQQILEDNCGEERLCW